MTRVIKALLIGTLLSTVLAACGAPPAGAGAGQTLQVVAGENFWGSIAAQLGGSHVSVTSIVTNPNTDPHSYESSATDARAFATADYVILNGAGYDDWGQKLLAANPSSSRKVITVADLLNKKAGDNPHFWYNPAWVDQVADKITSDYRALDPADAAYFTQQREAFATALKPYHDAIAHIRATSSGVAVGSTESIFVYMAQALGLNLISPPEFMQAISEGTDPPAQTVAQFQDQISHRQIKVLVYNTQTSTPITDNLKQLATRNGIPVVGISETVEPATAAFQDWQTKQLNSLQAALSRQ
jgi:zinc/manganese transport system substrate-binding protein